MYISLWNVDTKRENLNIEVQQVDTIYRYDIRAGKCLGESEWQSAYNRTITTIYQQQKQHTISAMNNGNPNYHCYYDN